MTTPKPNTAVAAWRDDLRSEASQRWEPWTRGGTPAATTSTFDTSGLTLALDTRGADPGAVCATGVCTREPLELGSRLTVRATLDWRAPRNACYRSAGLLLTSTPPGADPDGVDGRAVWLELVGVPPGETARLFAASRKGPWVTPLFTDGWPADRKGKPYRRVRLEVELTASDVVVRADGAVLARGQHSLGGRLWLVLYTQSHSNYAPRPVVFEAITVEGVGSAPTSVAALGPGS